MHRTTRARAALGALAATIAVSGALAAQAGAHARIFPTAVPAGTGSAYSLVVPNEKDGETITEVRLTIPKGFLIGGFEAARGWERTAEGGDGGHSSAITTVTWKSKGSVPSGEAAWFRFTGRPDEEAGKQPSAYRFGVEQTYSNGEVADWAGPEDSDLPAPVVQVTRAAATGGGASSGAQGAVEPAEEAAEATPAAPTASVAGDEDDGGDAKGTIALIIAVIALLLGLAALARGGGRSLT